MDRSTANVRSSINFLSNNDFEQREKIEIQLIPALQSFQTFIKMSNESQMAQIADSLIAIDFFKKNCPEGSSLRDFIMYAGKALTYEYYKKGSIIFHYGDYGDKFFMILKGNVGVLVYFKYCINMILLQYIQIVELIEQNCCIINLRGQKSICSKFLAFINFQILKIQTINPFLNLRIPKGNHDIEIDRDFIVETNRNELWSNVWKGRKLQSTIDMELLLAQGEDPWVISNRYFEGGVCLYQKIYAYYSGQTFGDVQLDIIFFDLFEKIFL